MTITSMDPFEIWARHYPDDEDQPGTEPGDECGRWQFLDDEYGVSKWQCTGTIAKMCGEVFCDECGWEAK